SMAIAALGGCALAVLTAAVFWFGAAPLLTRMGEVDLIRMTGITAAVLIWFETFDMVISSGLKGAEGFGQAARVEVLSKSAQVLGAALALLIVPALWCLFAVLLVVSVARLAAKV